MEEILDHLWFSSLKGTIGIVLVENDFRQTAYMCPVEGFDLKIDIQTVKECGAKLAFNHAMGFFPNKINPVKYKS